jgi:hypothetical protein
MRKLYVGMFSAVLALTWVASTTSIAARESGTDRSGSFQGIDRPSELAFTLEEMNCFSSDIRARQPAETYPPANDEVLDTRVAGSTGTNGIPCDSRDPKAPPKKKRSRS